MNRLKVCLSILFLLSAGISNGQVTDTAEKKLYTDFFKGFHIPVDMAPCKSFFVSVIVPIKNNSIDANLLFSTGCPSSLQDVFKKSILKLKPALLNTIFHGTAKAKDYNILMPFVFYSGVGCTEVIKPEQFHQIMEKGLSVPVKGPVYMMDPVYIESGKPTPRQ